jgi:hypothetical protein
MIEDWIFLDIGEVVGIAYGVCQVIETEDMHMMCVHPGLLLCVNTQAVRKPHLCDISMVLKLKKPMETSQRTWVTS